MFLLRLTIPSKVLCPDPDPTKIWKFINTTLEEIDVKIYFVQSVTICLRLVFGHFLFSLILFGASQITAFF